MILFFDNVLATAILAMDTYILHASEPDPASYVDVILYSLCWGGLQMAGVTFPTLADLDIPIHCLPCSKSQAYEASSLPFHVVGSAAASGSPSVQPCFAEVILDQLTGYRSPKSSKLSTEVSRRTFLEGSPRRSGISLSIFSVEARANFRITTSLLNCNYWQVTTETKMLRKGSNGVVDTGHVLIYPLDAVLVPMRPVVPSHPFIRR